MADDKVVIQITLDDGSIMKGFAKIEQQAQKVGKEIENSGGVGFFESMKSKIDEVSPALGKLADAAPRLIGVLGPIAIAALAIKKAFDFSVEGEQITALEKRFDMLASREGIDADKLKSSLESVAGGLVSLNDLFQSGARSIAIFGNQAEKLPDLLDLSKKSAAAFGGDTVQTFEALSGAIETGNLKALKNAGIIIDSEKVYQKYAKSLGLTSSELNQTQKQSALLDAVLEKGKETFKGVTTELTPLNNAIKSLGVAIQDSGEKTRQSFYNTFGAVFTEMIQAATVKLNKFNGVENIQTQVDLLNTKIKNTTDSIANLNSTIAYGAKNKLDIGAQMDASNAKVQLESLNKELVVYKTQLDELNKKKSVAPEVQKAIVKQQPLSQEQQDAIKARSAAVQMAIAKNEEAVIASREKLLIYEDDADTRREIKRDIHAQKIKLINEEEAAKILEINKTYSDKNGFDEIQRQELRLGMHKEYALKRTEVELAANEALARSAEQHKERIRIITAGLTNIVSQGSVKLAEALLKGGNAFEEFGKSIVGIIADEVVKLGQALIVQGLAIETFVDSINSLLPGSGAAAAAAGLGLVLFGTALKSAVGGAGGSSSGAAPSVTPGATGTTAPVGETTSTAFNPTQQQGTVVNVNVQGSIMDSQESGLRIVDLINSAFEKQGAVLVNQS